METQQPPPLPRENAREFTPVRRNMWRHFTYCMRHYADFRGRATRAEFWSFSAISALFSCLFLLPLFAALLICLQKIASNPETLEEMRIMGRALACMAAAEDAKGIDTSSINTTPLFRMQYDTNKDSLDLFELNEPQTFVPDASGTFFSVLNNNVLCAHIISQRLKRWEERPEESPMSLTAFASCAAASFALGGLWYLAILVPKLAATWRRLHDIGLSGAFYFVSFIPWVGGLVLFVLEIIDSKPGANKYGGPTKYP